MSYQPLRNKVLIKLDPEARMWHGLHLPDQNSLKYCKRCDKAMEALDGTRCEPREQFDWDSYHDRPDYAATTYEHDIAYATAPVILSPSRVGTVIAAGPACREVGVGSKVVISSTAGGCDGNTRLVPETVIFGLVE